MQELRKEVACLVAQMSRVKKVILRFGQEGWDKQGHAQGAFLGLLAGFSCSLHTPPTPLTGGWWLSFSATKPLPLAKFNWATSGRGGLPKSFSQCAGASGSSGLASESSETQMPSQEHLALAGLSLSPG